MKRIAFVIATCCFGVAALADDAAVDAVIDRLSAEDPAVRQLALDELVKLGAEAEPRLKARRETKDPEARVLIERALLEISLAPRRTRSWSGGPR